jgi:hypothetical protein
LCYNILNLFKGVIDMRLKTMLIVLTFILLAPCTFAANLDDPIQPQTPTVKSEILRGYQLAENMWSECDSNWNVYARKILDQYRHMNDKESTNDAFLAGYWLGAWAYHAYQSSSPGIWWPIGDENWRNDVKIYAREFQRCRISIGISEAEIGKLLDIDFQELKKLSHQS